MGRARSLTWMRGSLVGEGSFGQVNMALDAWSGEVFAVKSVECDGESHKRLAALEHEIAMLQRLDSEFVVHSLGNDWTCEGGRKFRNLWLEYMPGGSLGDVVKRFGGGCGLDEQLVRLFTAKILTALDYLHGRGVCHCDVKCANVLIGAGGAAKLADFGAAKVVGNSALARGAVVHGTPMWMAPEVVRHEAQGLPSDVWSLGCTVVEMASGKTPWSHIQNVCQVMYHVGHRNAAPAVPASLSAEAHAFLAHCFETDPQKRWTTSQLLQHPFVVRKGCGEVAAECELPVEPSPQSVALDCGSTGGDSTVTATSTVKCMDMARVRPKKAPRNPCLLLAPSTMKGPQLCAQ